MFLKRALCPLREFLQTGSLRGGSETAYRLEQQIGGKNLGNVVPQVFYRVDALFAIADARPVPNIERGAGKVVRQVHHAPIPAAAEP